MEHQILLQNTNSFFLLFQYLNNMQYISNKEHIILLNHPKLNIKVKLALLPKHRAMKMHGGMEVKFHGFLTSALDGGE
jgi:hypothetical protein